MKMQQQQQQEQQQQQRWGQDCTQPVTDGCVLIIQVIALLQ